MGINVGARVRNLQDVEAAATALPAQAVAAGRLLFVDNLRVFLTIMVVVFHLAITYGAEGSWFFRERPSTELAQILLSLFDVLNQFFFMGLFFLISGYFVPAALDKKGSLRFIKDRLVRLGIPLMLYSLLLSPLVEYVKAVNEGGYSGDLATFTGKMWSSLNFTPGPLWFVETLLIFCALYTLGKAVLSRANPGTARARATAFRQPLTHGRILALVAAIALLSFLVRLIMPIGEEWNHLQLAFFPQYVLLFAAGILAYRQGWLPEIPEKVRKVWIAIAIPAALALVVLFSIGSITEDLESYLGGVKLQAAVLAAVEGVYSISMSILMLSLFRRRFDFQGSLAQALSRNAYTVYIIHAPLIVGLALLARGIAIDPLLKFALISPVGVAVCFLASHYLVRRIPLADRVL